MGGVGEKKESAAKESLRVRSCMEPTASEWNSELSVELGRRCLYDPLGNLTQPVQPVVDTLARPLPDKYSKHSDHWGGFPFGRTASF